MTARDQHQPTNPRAIAVFAAAVGIAAYTDPGP